MRTLAFSTAALLSAAATPAFAAPAQTSTWSVEAPKDAPTALAFADPADGKMTLRLTCARGTGQVVAEYALSVRRADHKDGGVWIDASGNRAPWPASVVFASGGVSSSLRGLVQADAATGASVAATEISTAAPPIRAFARTGQISLTVQGETLSPPPAPLSLLRKFLGPCR